MGWQNRYLILSKSKLIYFADPAVDVSPKGRLDFELLSFGIECLWNPADFHDHGPDPSAQPDHLSHVPVAGSRRAVVHSNSTAQTGLINYFVGCCGARKFCCGARSRAASQHVVFRIRPFGSKRAFEFKGPYAEVVEWVEALRPLASHCQSDNLSYLSIVAARHPHFWKIDRISPKKFQEIVDTGDVILFRTKRTVSRIQRILTGGVYDHVGLVIRKKNGNLQLLEAMGDTGVALQGWTMFIERGWFLAYERVAIRRLHFPRSRTKLNALAEFCKENVGKPYKLSVSKLMKTETIGGDKEDFFCSELVANALKILGALKLDAPSAHYWPSSFGQMANPPLPLENNSSLDDELIVDFHLDPQIGAQLQVMGVD
eukprot:Selendium_serpulae@DN11131_c0_g1_i1.p1